MAFTNVQIDLSTLPIADELAMEPMAETYEREVKTQLLIIFLPILIASVLPFILAQISFLLAIPAVLLLLAIVISRLVIRKALVKGVALREFDVAYRSGLFWRKTVIVAFNRVQHVEVSSGPLQRKFGLATVKFFTAGGSSVDLKVDGLSTERAEQMRAFIANKIDAINNSMSLSGEKTSWQRTSPVAVVFFLLSSARQVISNGLPAIAVVIATFASASATGKSWMLTGLLGLALLTAVGAIAQWVRFRFCVVNDKVLVRSGVFQHEELIVEFGRIQNISIREPIYMRPFGLALFSIDTAGSGQKEIVLGGIKQDVALQLRDTILTRARPDTSSPTEESEDPADKSLLLSRNVKDIVIYGLTVNFALWVVVAVGAFFGAFDAAENFFTWLSNYIQFEDIKAAIEQAGGLIGAALITIVALFLIFLLLPLISVAGALVRHYDYRLRVEGETYRKNSGLLTRHDESMKRHKIQAMVLRQNFVARFFKRTNMQLRIASAGSGVESGQLLTGTKTTFLVPALNDDELSELIPEFLPGCEYNDVQFSRINRRRFSLVVLGWSVLPPLLLVTTILSTLISWMFLLLLPVVLAFAWVLVSQVWKKSGYGVVGDYGFIRHGFLGAEITIFPLFKVQRVDIRQTPGQRRKKLAHLAIHLASHSLKISYVDERDAKQFRDMALYHVESSNRAWY